MKMVLDDSITLFAINPKTNNQTTDLQLQIPRESLDDVILELIKFKQTNE